MTDTNPSPTESVREDAAFGSLIEFLTGEAYLHCETADPDRQHRFYYECKLCGGTDETRGHYKNERRLVRHKSDCMMLTYGERLKTLVSKPSTPTSREQALEDALKPFAEILKHKFTNPLDWNDDDGLAVRFDGKDITVGDLRRAAQVLAKSSPPTGDARVTVPRCAFCRGAKQVHIDLPRDCWIPMKDGIYEVLNGDTHVCVRGVSQSIIKDCPICVAAPQTHATDDEAGRRKNYVSCHFTNEAGNYIHIKLATSFAEGMDGVLIEMLGPRSKSSNLVTRFEAEKLHEALSALLAAFTQEN